MYPPIFCDYLLHKHMHYGAMIANLPLLASSLYTYDIISAEILCPSFFFLLHAHFYVSYQRAVFLLNDPAHLVTLNFNCILNVDFMR